MLQEETDPAQARRDKEKIDRLIAEQAEEQRLGHKLYKGDMYPDDEEKQIKKKKRKLIFFSKVECLFPRYM